MPIATEMGDNRQFSDRFAGHGAVLAGELLAVPLSIAATSLVLLGALFALYLLRGVAVFVAIVGNVLGVLLGVSGFAIPFWIDVVLGAVVLATLVALASFGGFAVVLYRRAFERFDHLHPATVVAVPLLGLALSGYLLVTTGVEESSWWLFAFTALWAHALMYRTIAMDARLGGDPDVGALVGSVAALPAVVSEVVLVAWYAGSRDLVRQVLAEASAVGVPLHRSMLVLVPVVVTVAYGVHRAPRLEGLTELAASLQLPKLPSRSASASEPDATPPQDWVPRSASAVGPADSTANRGTDSTGGTGRGSDDTSTGRRSDTDSTGYGSDRSSTSDSADSEDRSSGGSGDATDNRSGGRSDVATDDGGSGGSDDTTDDRSGGRGDDATDAMDSEDRSDRGDATDDGAATSDGSSSTDGRSNSNASSRASDGPDTELYDHSSPVEGASDTRIYTGDGPAVAPCPDCGRDVLVADDAKFCPKCGAEL